MKNTKKREKEIKGYAVLRETAPYTPVSYYYVFSVFKTKKSAKEWVDENVHPMNGKKIVECTITYKIT